MDNKTLVRELFEAVSDRRAENLPDYLALDVVDHNKMIHGEPDEPGAAFEGIRMQLAAFDPLTMHVDELIAEGDRVTARITMSGTHTGTHIRMPRPTGRHFEIEAVFILTLAEGAEGKVTEIRAVSDRLGLFLQLGWDWPTVD